MRPDEELHEPQNRYEAADWLAKARRDLAAASNLIVVSPPLPDVALFHAQQAAEKSWKAMLAWHGLPFRKTHDLRELGQQLLAVEPALRDLVLEAEELTPFAWAFRYPGESDEPTVAEARAAIDLAQRVFETAGRSTGFA